MTTAVRLTLDEARILRQNVVDGLGCSEADLRTRGDQYLLSSEELAALDRLNELDFLLGG